MPGLLGEIFGAPSGKLLEKEERQGAERQAVMDMGLSLMANSMPSSFNEPSKPLFQALALGVMSGRGAYKRYADATRAAATATDIEELMSGPMSLDTLKSTYQRALAGGDVETARTVGPLIQSMLRAEAESAENPRNLQFREDPQTGNMVVVDPTPGSVGVVMRFNGAYRDENGELQIPLNPVEKKHVLDLTNKYLQHQSYTQASDVANSFKRVAVHAQALMNAEEDAQKAKDMGQDYQAPIADTMALISSFARLLDPNSVVKEGEYRIVSNVGGFMDRMKNWTKMMRDGTFTERTAQQFLNAAVREANARRGTVQALRQQFWMTGDSVGLDPDDMPLMDPFVEAFRSIGIDVDAVAIGEDANAWLGDMDADLSTRAPLVTPPVSEEEEDGRTDYQKQIDKIIGAGTSARTGGF